jgi:peptidoglycan/xylan/chitin deacetylase (PgdA/CDA1 family)
LGYELVLWDLDPQDWRQPGADQIAQHIIDNARPGAIVLMHDGGGHREQTVAALKTVLSTLSEQGYRFEALCR